MSIVETEVITTVKPIARGHVRTAPGHERRARVAAIPFVGAALAVVGIVLLVPFAFTVYRSFVGNVDGEFVALDNYVKMFSDPALQRSMVNTTLFAIGSLILPVGLGLAIAVMTSAMKWGAVARALVVVPYALSGTVVAIVGNMMLSTSGSLNQALAFLGLADPDAPTQWLLQWPMNVITIIFFAAWQATGVNVVLYMVGLQTIPRETVEAAALDGADGWRRFRYVIFPQLRATTAVVIGLTITGALRAFDMIWVLTSGGPNRSSETLALSMYRQAFLMLDPGVGSAIAVILTIIVVVCSWLYLRRQIGQES